MKIEKEKMAEKKNAKYFVTSDKKDLKLPSYRHIMDPAFVKRVLQLDSEAVPGADFYSEVMWIIPGSEAPLTQVDSHTHTWGEMIGFFGFNYEDIKDLGAEIEFTIDNEKHIITNSFAAFVPAGIQHGPLIIRNVVRPIFHFTAGPCKIYK
jgi:hypothetical protein